MATRKQRATAARKAYKSVVSDVSGKDTGSAYSPRGFIKSSYSAKRARVIGKQISKSAAQPGKASNTIKWGPPNAKRTAKLGPRHAINFGKLAKTMLVHSTPGEVTGVTRDIRQAYKKNLRKATRKSK